MKSTRRNWPGVILLLLLLLMATGALAGPNAAITMSWWTVDGGGGVSTGGDYHLQSTISQADAGYLTGGDLTLQGGFWGGVVTLSDLPFKSLLPLVSGR